MTRLALLFSVVLLAGCGWFNPLTQITSRSSGPARAHSSSGCTFALPLSAELPDGALVIGTSCRKGSKLVVSLQRVNPDGQDYNLALVSVPAGTVGTIDAIVATPQAELLLGGSDGKHELVGRLLATGRTDSTFGHGGWVRLAPHEKVFKGMPPPAFTATSIAVGPSGEIFVGGNDGGAHCCTRDFVSEFNPVGVAVRTTFLPSFGGSYTTNVYANRDGSVYALGEYEQSGCGGPSIVRISRDGSLDAGFDAAIRKTVRRVMSQPNLRFTPTLVPEGSNGAFALVGGLDETCVANQSAKLRSGGVEVAVNASGQMSRKLTRFASPNYAFDSPTAIWLPSGRIVTAAIEYTANGGQPNSVLVQSLAPSGAVGQRTSMPPTQSTSTASVALFSGSANSVRLVVGAPGRFGVTRVAIGG